MLDTCSNLHVFGTFDAYMFIQLHICGTQVHVETAPFLTVAVNHKHAAPAIFGTVGHNLVHGLAIV